MLHKKYTRVFHECTLNTGSGSCLPREPPHASRFYKWLREFRKIMTISSKSDHSKFFFKSRSAIITEQKRHIRLYPYIIHPLSSLSAHLKVIASITWFYCFFEDPFTTAFYYHIDLEAENTLFCILWQTVDTLGDLFMVIYCFLCFITGTVDDQTKEIELRPKKIALRYIKSYFIFDFLSALPIHQLSAIFGYDDKRSSMSLSALHFFRFVRIKTVIKYCKGREGLYVEDSAYQILCIVLLSCLFLHWWACLLYLVPQLKFSKFKKISESSWLVKANIHPTSNATLLEKYLECFLNALCHFYKAGNGMYEIDDPLERTMMACILITGIYYSAYVVGVILQMVSSAGSSESKFEELTTQLKEYMRKKKLPDHTRQRLLTYYQNRYQKHYFKEHAILNTLSDHLRYEIFLHSCRGLIAKVPFFQGLSKRTIGSIIACLKHEIFLPNDVIIKTGNPAVQMYFISYGKVAIFLTNGKELCHLEDGDQFGEIGLMLPNVGKAVIGHVVAIEITEIFTMHKKDLVQCMQQDDEIAARLEKTAKKRILYIEEWEKAQICDEIKEKRDIIFELRKGRILEHSRGYRRK